jgi:spermidine/putrescine-binding protein
VVRLIQSSIPVIALLVATVACSPEGNEQGKGKPVTLHLFTWSDYTEETAVKEFERRLGVKVVTDTFGSNEELLAKLQGGAAGYDVVVPSDYMVSILIKQGLLAELDHAKIPNLAHVYPHLKGLYYDPQNTYSVPYLWGTTGIGYNADVVTPPPKSWQVLWDARYKRKISLLNDEREVFGMALRAAGESLNATQPTKLEAAKARLMAQKPLVKTYTSENYDQLLVSGEVALAHGWSGTIMRAAAERPSIKYVIPQEGGTIWQDNLSVLKSSKHQEDAMTFINFMLDPQIAALTTAKVMYASANEEARLFLPREIAQNPAVYPPESVVARLEWIKDVGEAIKLYDRAWTELKVK